MIASLMMYRRPQLEDAHTVYWNLVRDNLRAVGMDSPAHLSQDADEFSVWNDSELVLSQTCGMPYRTWLHDKVELVGTPDFGVSGCPPGYYRSALVARADDPRANVGDYLDSVFAYNQTFSQSGYAAAYWHLEPWGFWFRNRLHARQHLESARAVADGRADIASLDAVSWRLISRYESFANDVRVLEWTMPTPGLPLVTARGNDADLVFTAVEKAILQLSDEIRALLGLKGIVRIPKESYLQVPNPPRTPAEPS